MDSPLNKHHAVGLFTGSIIQRLGILLSTACVALGFRKSSISESTSNTETQ